MNMIEEEKRFRRQMILLAIGLLAFFTGVIALNFFDGDIVWTFYPSALAGIFLGIKTCIYLSEAWDPENLAMKESSVLTNTESRIPWHWGAPLGVLAGNIVAQFLGNEIRNLFMGLPIGWFCVVLVYSIVQVWRHGPK
jgi:hypothetical protein